MAHNTAECLCLDCIQYFAIGGYLKLCIDLKEPDEGELRCASCNSPTSDPLIAEYPKVGSLLVKLCAMTIAAHEEYIGHKMKMDEGQADSTLSHIMSHKLKQEDDVRQECDNDSDEEDTESLRLYDAFQTAHDNAKELAITWKGVSSSKQERDKVAENFLRMKDVVDKAGHDYKRAVWYGNKDQRNSALQKFRICKRGLAKAKETLAESDLDFAGRVEYMHMVVSGMVEVGPVNTSYGAMDAELVSSI